MPAYPPAELLGGPHDGAVHVLTPAAPLLDFPTRLRGVVHRYTLLPTLPAPVYVYAGEVERAPVQAMGEGWEG